jgi:hypothetical protein
VGLVALRLRQWNMNAPSLRGLSGLASRGADLELSRLGMTYGEALCLALRRMPDEFFGTATRPNQVANELRELQAIRASLVPYVELVERVKAVLAEVAEVSDPELADDLEALLRGALRKARAA